MAGENICTCTLPKISSKNPVRAERLTRLQKPWIVLSHEELFEGINECVIDVYLSSSSSSCCCSLITDFLYPGTSPLEPVLNPTTQASSLSL
jgi:hypothetical protein